jgi:hypothetical protein
MIMTEATMRYVAGTNPDCQFAVSPLDVGFVVFYLFGPDLDDCSVLVSTNSHRQRVFKTIDAAVSCIRGVGYARVVQVWQ